MAELTTIHNILALYEQASSQQLKREKTMLFFNKAVSEDTKSRITSFLGVPKVKEYEKYLGLLAVVGRNKKASLIYINERVWSKLQGWKEKLLSQAGREILLKAVVQAIPTFTVSCFKLLVGLCNEIESLIRKFFWGQKGEQRKIHWKKWETLCKPKTKGGLGFKDLVKFNESAPCKTGVEAAARSQFSVLSGVQGKVLPNKVCFLCKIICGVICVAQHTQS